ncbi:low choriolytic enzyme-like [Amblyraja radiata]|uniref:low choriolytic enzyme-like n=1 Tax=Amblyraja radiata TaxID=386614 RepID=UPI001403659F|nr:low choriolytic enzyme-like [Amblyraja radiata]
MFTAPRFDFLIVYKRGTEMHLADALSWAPGPPVTGSSKSFVEYGDIATGNSKNAIKCLRGPKSCLWPRSRDGNVYIPYTLDTYFTKEHQKIIYNAMQEFDDLTCIKFVYRRHQINYIKIIAGDGCWSNIGYNGRIQVTSLQRYGCTIRGIIQHELLHTIGFNHEQNRSDRDTYVTILLDKVIEEARYNFIKLNTNNLGMPYDYNSVMHYGRYAFSKDGQSSTIVPKPDPQTTIGQRFGMSTLDINKVNKLYHCSKLIYDGDNSLSHVLDGPNCGAENPAVISSGAALLVEFFTSRSQRAQGFSANFQFGNTLIHTCPAIHSAAPSPVHSPAAQQEVRSRLSSRSAAPSPANSPAAEHEARSRLGSGFPTEPEIT